MLRAEHTRSVSRDGALRHGTPCFMLSIGHPADRVSLPATQLAHPAGKVLPALHPRAVQLRGVVCLRQRLRVPRGRSLRGEEVLQALRQLALVGSRPEVLSTVHAGPLRGGQALLPGHRCWRIRVSLSSRLGRLLLGSSWTVLRARISRAVQCWTVFCLQRDKPSDGVQLLQEPRLLGAQSNLRRGGNAGTVPCQPGGC